MMLTFQRVNHDINGILARFLCDFKLASPDDNWLTCCTWSAGMFPLGGLSPPPILFLELTNWSKNELVSWSKFINLYHFYHFFPILMVENDKKLLNYSLLSDWLYIINNWAKKWPAVYFTLIKIYQRWSKCPTVGRNDCPPPHPRWHRTIPDGQELMLPHCHWKEPDAKPWRL